jgi:hypothetical protein
MSRIYGRVAGFANDSVTVTTPLLLLTLAQCADADPAARAPLYALRWCAVNPCSSRVCVSPRADLRHRFP